MKQQTSQQTVCSRKENGGHSSRRNQRRTSWRKVALDLNLGSCVRDLKVEMARSCEQKHGMQLRNSTLFIVAGGRMYLDMRLNEVAGVLDGLDYQVWQQIPDIGESQILSTDYFILVRFHYMLIVGNLENKETYKDSIIHSRKIPVKFFCEFLFSV